VKEQKMEIMHKNTPVATVLFDERGFVSEVKKIHNRELLPCLDSEDKKDLRLGLQRWLLSRDLGRTRTDFGPLRTFYGNHLFISKNKASLYDCYWLKGDEKETWETESAFANWDYEDDEYFDLLFDPENIEQVHGKSPNLTLPGLTHQFWYRKDGQLGLISENSQKEMKMYKKALELGVEKYVSKRDYMIVRGVIYTFRNVPTSENVERIPFDILYDSVAKEENSKIKNLSICCQKYNLENWRDFFVSVVKLDEAMGNKDRALCEFGVLRDANTLETIGFEPI